MRNNDLCGLCFGYAMEELSPQQTKWFAVHLEGCSRCQTEYDELRDLRSVVEQSFINELTATSSYKSRRMNTSWVGVTAAVMLTLFAAFPQHHALANRLEETAQDLHTGISHQARFISLEARKVIDSHWRIRRTKAVQPASGALQHRQVMSEQL